MLEDWHTGLSGKGAAQREDSREAACRVNP